MMWKLFSKEKKRYPAQNSRRYPRLKANYLIRYFLMAGDQQEEIRTANTKDISMGGVRFLSHEAVDMGRMLRVHILIPVLGDFIAAFSRVEKIQQDPQSKLYTISLSFVEMSEKDHKRLESFISKCSEVKEADRLFDNPSIAKRAVES